MEQNLHQDAKNGDNLGKYSKYFAMLKGMTRNAVAYVL